MMDLHEWVGKSLDGASVLRNYSDLVTDHLEHIAYESCQEEAREQYQRIARSRERNCTDWQCGGCPYCLTAMIGYMHDWRRPEIRESWLNHFA